MHIKFNPDNKVSLTYGECLNPAMTIHGESEAQQYLADYIAFIQKSLDKEPRNDGKTAAQIASINLGYYAGYYGSETRARVERLFKCAYPIFGATAQFGSPTTTEAFDAGKRLAESK